MAAKSCWRNMSRLLIVFDFDHTIIDRNSDVVLRDLLPHDVLSSKKLKGLRPSWTAYMAEVFRLLPQHGIDRTAILNTCRNLEPTDGMLQLFHYLKSIDAEIVILSDANSEIISAWLGENLPELTVEVFTNPAVWSEGVLRVKPYQQQTACKSCPINLCKRTVLDKYLESRCFDIVAYVGDGKNDLCPAQTLRPGDLLFPRSGYTLETLLSSHPVAASVHVWSSAALIKSEIYQALL